MSAVLKSDVSPRRSASVHPVSEVPNGLFAGHQSSRSRSQLTQPVSLSDLQPKIRRLPSPRPTPAWLKFLVAVQRGSTVATWSCIAGALVLYGWTVYSQQAWSRTYQKLDRLQRNEQQMMAASALLKEHMAEQAETAGSGLVMAKPYNNIFLKQAPQRPAPPDSTATETSPLSVSDLPKPLGY